MDDSSELSSLLASLEDIAQRVSTLVETTAGIDGVDAELVALERSLVGDSDAAGSLPLTSPC